MEKTDNKNPTLEEQTFKLEKNKFIAEFVKWFIGSVALVVITLIIDKGFKDRSAGIQEMQAYDKYVEVILEADNIEQRWKLSEYFAIVTPTERLRERWEAYQDSIKDEYEIYKNLIKKEEELEIQKNMLLSQAIKNEELQNKDTSLVKKHKESLVALNNQLDEIKFQKAPMEKKLILSNNLGSAQSWEEKGFSYLFNKDIDNAVQAFQNSENAYNQFHQVYEIAKYLNENKSKLKSSDSEFWKTTYKKIATDYSWKMSLETRNKLLENAK